MSTLLVRAEIEKLARLLGVEVSRLAYLEKLPADDVRELRERATDRLFDADRGAFDRIAAASRVVPDGLSATLSQKVFGPLFTARMTAAVPPSTAINVAKKLPHDFLADVAALLDPRRAPDVISGLPPDQIAKTSQVLAQRSEWVAMGRFVGHLGREALRQTIDGLDDEALLRIAFVMEEPEALTTVLSLMSEDRIAGTFHAAQEHSLWPEAISLLAHLDGEQTARVLGVLGAAEDDELLSDLVDTASQDPDAVQTLVAVSIERGLEDDLLALLSRLDRDEQQALLKPARALPAAQRRKLKAHAEKAGLLEDLGPLADAI